MKAELGGFRRSCYQEESQSVIEVTDAESRFSPANLI